MVGRGSKNQRCIWGIRQKRRKERDRVRLESRIKYLDKEKEEKWVANKGKGAMGRERGDRGSNGRGDR